MFATTSKFLMKIIKILTMQKWSTDVWCMNFWCGSISTVGTSLKKTALLAIFRIALFSTKALQWGSVRKRGQTKG